MTHLTGGRTTSSVVRIGETVRRSPGLQAAFVHDVLVELERHDFQGAPRFLGTDENGREVLSYLPGDVPSELGWFSDATLTGAARLLRALHDVTAESSLRGSAEVICHGDPSPCNAVFRDGMASAFIDFDAVHPGARREDVGYAVWLWLDIGNEDICAEIQGKRLGTFVRACGELMMADSVAAVLDAQTTLMTRPGVPGPVQRWAKKCRDWTTVHRVALGKGAEASIHPPGDPYGARCSSQGNFVRP
jgi:hypothetical protein